MGNCGEKMGDIFLICPEGGVSSGDSVCPGILWKDCVALKLEDVILE